MPAPRSIPSGTITIFCQAAAPVGWTKLTTHDDRALRVVSGAVGTGGSSPFTACFTSKSVTASLSLSRTIGAHTLSTSQLPSHNHGSGQGNAQPVGLGYLAPSGAFIYQNGTPQSLSGPSGGGGSHAHSSPGSAAPVSFPSGTFQDLALAYVDVIQCSRN